ncbi:phospho-sugar mutase [Actinomadura scrupuli]|uniref:phospho-sugar mutase n=1 Tax=Actinomadura scrupuli TaxID=559629 RepID=UPI003D96ED12
MTGTYRERALEWLAQDPDPATRAELRALLDAEAGDTGAGSTGAEGTGAGDTDAGDTAGGPAAGDTVAGDSLAGNTVAGNTAAGDTAAGNTAAGARAALTDRFGAKLEFGTAGLRGEMGAGPNRMNRVTVMRAAAGLAARLLRSATSTPSVVIGYDARHGSERFARDTAAVMTGAGLTAWLMPRTLPTPVLAFAVRFLGADAGVMVTASHNPPRDNGYKVYWGDGAQIVPPLDTEISAAIDAVGRVDELPLGEHWTVLGEEIVEAYLQALTTIPLGTARDVTVAYTALHGVGAETLAQAFQRAGFPAPLPVEEQITPDPDFPTVAFPNPEEPGAMDLVLRLAEVRGADLVIANDPDADRCAVAVPLPPVLPPVPQVAADPATGRTGGAGREWRMLTGDEVGGLLAEHVLRHTSGPDRTVVTTIVSSSLLGRIAAAHGVRFAESLTGFKWIVKAAGPGDRFVFGYEEALGYCVGGDDGPVVLDKDGIGAALAVAGLAAEAARDGRTLLDLLDDQARRYGVHATGQLSFRVDDLALITDAMARLRKAPPSRLAGRAVTAVDDLATGAGGLPPTDGLRLRLDPAPGSAGEPGSGARVVVRPSGTEPKLKCYLEIVAPVGTSADGVTEVRTRTAAELTALRDALSELFSFA